MQSPWEDTEKVLWVEATKESQKISSIEIKLRYDGFERSVFATAVWAKKTAVEHNRKTAAQILSAYSNLKDRAVHSPAKRVVENINGTGLIPPRFNDVYNGILFQFTVSPPGIGKYKTIISFDVTRRAEMQSKLFDAADNELAIPGLVKTKKFPDIHPDAANDDGEDNSTHPDDKDQMYSADGPGFTFGAGNDNAKRATYSGQFEEYIRVNIGVLHDPDLPPQPPQGGWEYDPKVLGSRASPKYEWEVQHTLKHEAGGDWKRTTGDDAETDENHVRESEDE